MSTDINSIVDRLARLLEMQAEIAADIKDIKAEAKSTGLDPVLLMKVARLKLADAAKRKAALDQHEMLDVYLAAAGLLPGGDTKSAGGLIPAGGRQEVELPPSAPDDTDGNQGEAAAGGALGPVGRSTGATSAGSPVHLTPEVLQVVAPSVPAAPFSRVERRPAAETASHVSAATLSRPAPEAREMEIV